MKNFSIIQKLRKKIRIEGNYTISIAKSVKLVNCKIEILGNCSLLE